MRGAALALFLSAAGAFAQQPRIDRVSPAQGPIAGGTTVTIDGANFAGATVRLDGHPVAPLSQSDSEVRLQMQPHDNGYVVLSIGNAGGSAEDEFLYVPPRLRDLPPGSVTTVAGVGNYVRTFGPANRAYVMPVCIAWDAGANLYMTEAGQHRVTRVDAAGNIHPFAGGNFLQNEQLPDYVPALEGGVSFPWGVAVGPGGNVYIGTHAPVLRMVDVRTGVIVNVAGNNTRGFSGDGGPARDAVTGQVTAVAADASNVYFLDWDNARIRRVDANGTISTVAGNGIVGYGGDGGPATAASFFFGNPDEGAIALDPQGNLFIADAQNGAIRKVDRSTGIINTFYRPPRDSGFDHDFVGVVRALATDGDGNLYYGGGGRIVKLNAKGEFVTAWGAGRYGFSDDGPVDSSLRMSLIMGIAIDAAGNLVYTDGFRVRRIDLTRNRLETIAGIHPAYPHENGPAVAAPIMDDNMDLAIAPDGALLIGDFRLRRLDGDGNLQTIAGGHPDFSIYDDVPADKMYDTCLAIDVNPDGAIDLANTGDIRRLAAGVYRRLGGKDANCAYDGDGGQFTDAHLCQPWDTARDAAGNLYIADTNNNRIRRVDAKSGIITTFAGGGGPVSGIEGYGRGTYCGDGGPAAAACLNTPYGLAVDTDGSVFVSEQWQRIRRIAPNGTITTFASAIGGISKIVFGPVRYLYTTAIERAGRFDRNGTFETIAGSGQRGFSGDGGPALQASMNSGGQAAGVAIDSEGNFYFQDSANRRVRAVRFGAVLAPPNATIAATATAPVISVTVRDASGRPSPSVRVDFTAPASGASCTLSSPFGITGIDGTASVTCTPNCLAGTYEVAAQPLTASSTARVSFTNSGTPCRRRAARH